MQAKVFVPKIGGVLAIQIPLRTPALQAQWLPAIRELLREPEAKLDPETGELLMPEADAFGGSKALPGDWLVLVDGSLELYEPEAFNDLFIDPADMAPEVKGWAMPPDLPVPPVVHAATSLLVEHDRWPAGAHLALVGLLAHYHRTTLPQGFVGLSIDRLWKLDRADYEKLQALFPNLPDMPALISLDTSIGARH